MEKRGKFILTSLDEVLDKHIGPVGSPEGAEFDKEVDDALERITPSRAIHPGEILREELEARELKQKDFAESIGMRPSHLNDFLKGRRNMTEGFAKKLEAALGTPAETWMRLHYFYLQDLKALAESSRIKEKKSLADIIKDAIARQGFSQKQVADIVGVSESQIAAYTTGEECPTLQTAGSLCMALGIAPATMLGI